MVRILRTSPTGAQIGYEDGRWFVETGRGFVSLELPSGFMGVLPLLERSYSEVYQDLREALEGRGISPGLADSFPANALVSYSLREGSAYWKEQALRWLKEMPVSAELIEPLKSICEGRLWPQALRHEAQRCLKSLRKRTEEKAD